MCGYVGLLYLGINMIIQIILYLCTDLNIVFIYCAWSTGHDDGFIARNVIVYKLDIIMFSREKRLLKNFQQVLS